MQIRVHLYVHLQAARWSFLPNFFPLRIPEKHAGKVIMNIQSTPSSAQRAPELPSTPAPPQQPVDLSGPPSRLRAFGEGDGRLWSAYNPNLCPLWGLLPALQCPPWLWQEAAGKSSLSPRPPGASYIWMLKVMTHLHAVLPPACLTP